MTSEPRLECGTHMPVFARSRPGPATVASSQVVHPHRMPQLEYGENQNEKPTIQNSKPKPKPKPKPLFPARTLSMPVVAPDRQKEEVTVVASCLVCCEDKSSSAMLALSKCSHESCRDCLRQWIVRAEVAGEESLPACPFCRLQLAVTDVLLILGRPFQPQTSKVAGTMGEPMIDDLTLQWLQEYTKPCPRCHARIEKIDGCDMLECLCGYRFCFRCSSPGARCTCTPSHHVFWDNVFDIASDRAAVAPLLAGMDDETGHVNLLSHIRQRKAHAHMVAYRGQRALEHKRAKTRRANQWRRERLERQERTKVMDETFLMIKWFFQGRGAGLRMLGQISQTSMRRVERFHRRRQVEEEQKNEKENTMGARWLFYTTTKGLPRFFTKKFTAKGGSTPRSVRDAVILARRRTLEQREQELLDSDETLLTTSRWLFASKGRRDQVLSQRLRREQVQQDRAHSRLREKREQDLGDPLFKSTKWLFCKKSTNSLRVMRQQLDAQWLTNSRQRRRRDARQGQHDATKLVVAATWLFCPSAEASISVLEKQSGKKAERVRRQRLLYQRHVASMFRQRVEFGASFSSPMPIIF
jgi:hypothetical protein